MDRVDFDGGVFERVGEVDSVGVDSGLADVVGGGSFKVVDRGAGGGVECERSEDTADIYDSALGGFGNEGEEGLSGFYETKKVCVESVAVGLGRSFFDGGLRGVEVNASVVDEDIKVSKLGFDRFYGGGD